ncbi:hypothetical protein DFH09DRAFT_916355 [Mycena vulgaris]|nr:hypothetical protein DFH09DRAFT_916355 [Mycena vulgaris]
MEWSPTDGIIPAFAIECFVGSIFGAIHCATWSADFPSASEMWMWKAFLLIVTAIPVFLPAIAVLGATTENDMIHTILLAIFYAAIPTYIIARLFLLTLPFAALHALPPGAFEDVNCNIYIPHH